MIRPTAVETRVSQRHTFAVVDAAVAAADVSVASN